VRGVELNIKYFTRCRRSHTMARRKQTEKKVELVTNIPHNTGNTYATCICVFEEKIYIFT